MNGLQVSNSGLYMPPSLILPHQFGGMGGGMQRMDGMGERFHGFLPTYYSNLALWYDVTDPNTILMASGVARLDDKSGNGRHATQGTGASQPALSTINGRPAIHSDATPKAMTIPNFAGMHLGGTCYCVFEIDSATVSGPFPGIYCLDGPANGDLAQRHPLAYITPSPLIDIDTSGTGGNRGLNPAANNTPYVTSFYFSPSGDTRASFNGTITPIGTGNAYTAGTSDGFLLGNGGSGIKLSELIVYQAIHTTPQLGAVKRYLSLKYEISLT